MLNSAKNVNIQITFLTNFLQFFKAFIAFYIRIYIVRIKQYIQNLSRNDTKSFVFYNYSHSSSRTKKDYYQTLNKYSTTFPKNVPVYFFKNTPKLKSLQLTNSYNLFSFHDNFFSLSRLKLLTDKKKKF